MEKETSLTIAMKKTPKKTKMLMNRPAHLGLSVLQSWSQY